MQKKVLIAVDGSIHAQNGLTYAADLLSRAGDFRFGIMHVQPTVSQFLPAEGGREAVVREALEGMAEHNRVQSEELLAKSSQLLVSRGIDPASIELISRPPSLGLAKDIIDYAHIHGFDALVAGRRGLSRVQKIFMGSTSATLVEYSGVVPVWIVDGDVQAGNFFVAVDAASPWTNILDHLCLICAGLGDIRLTFFCVLHRDALEERRFTIPGMDRVRELLSRNEEQLIDTFWKEAARRLAAAGLDRRQFELQTAHQSGRIGKMIMDRIDAGVYGTVVLGRRGRDKAFFFGSVSRYVIERLTGHAIWVVQA